MNYSVSNDCKRIRLHPQPHSYLLVLSYSLLLLIGSIALYPPLLKAATGTALSTEFIDYSEIELRYIDTETGFSPILTEIDRERSSLEILHEDYQKTYLPSDEIFHPLVADLKEHQFYASFHHFNTDLIIGNFTAASVGFGERFGLIRWSKLEDAWQLSIAGGLFAQFNMDSNSADLINADYQIGLNLTRVIERKEFRFRLFHQSTHLGDEFIIRNKPDRINFNYEKLDAMACLRNRKARACAGVGFLVHVNPSDYDRLSFQFDAEYRSFKGPTFLGPFGRYLAAIDVKFNEQQEWNPNVSVKCGIEFGEANRGRRRIRLMIEGYHGYVPFGQFYDRKMSSIGIGGYLGF
jgi:hypothetical protein